MTNFTYLIRHLEPHLRHNLPSLKLKLTYPWQCLCYILSSPSRYLRRHSFLLHLLYFLSISCIGFLLLKSTSSPSSSFPPNNNLDLFFTSVSAVTASSMSVIEMELFSNTQLLVLTLLMFIGGEVFTSAVGLHFKKRRLQKLLLEDKVASVTDTDAELGEKIPEIPLQSPDYMRFRSVRLLGYFVLAYLVGSLLLGTSLVSAYLTMVPTARDVLQQKGLKRLTFSVFTTVSTFVNCGFVPTNENMIVFRKNSGLLLILMPLVLMGNTLFPWCLRVSLWAFGKFTKKEDQVINYLLNNNTKETSFQHLLPKLHTRFLFRTVFGFIGVQSVMFCALEWSGESLRGLSAYEKVVGAVFMSVNSRHAGENVVDISAIAPAMVVIFVVMIYLPPYTSFLPVKKVDEEEEDSEVVEKHKKQSIQNLIFSQLSYLAVFVILICISERDNMKRDPLNFSVLSIVVEVISAYGNVGYTMGYSCKRQVTPEVGCKDKSFGFSGKWNDESKILLILVMIFGRLKQFSINGGQAWKLL